MNKEDGVKTYIVGLDTVLCDVIGRAWRAITVPDSCLKLISIVE